MNMLTQAIVFGVAVVVLGFSGGAVMAQTASDTSLVTLKPKPKPARVPEPASIVLLGAGLAGLGLWKSASKKD